MPSLQLNNGQALIAYLLAAFLDHGHVCQFDQATLAEAVIRVANGNYLFDLDEAPDGSVIMRLVK